MATIDQTSDSTYQDEFTRDGYIFEKDPEAGQRVEEMEAACIPFASQAGLQFYKTNVLDDPVSPVLAILLHLKADFAKRKRQVLDSCFQWFGLGLYRTFGSMPGCDYAFRQSDLSSKTESLLIQFWKKGSKVTFWKGSHHKQITTMKGENNLWRAPRVALTRLGLEPVHVIFENGGL
jgi:hypothetical protein